MSRINDLGEILEWYEGREYVPEKTNWQYKNLYLIIDSSSFISSEMFDLIKEGGRRVINYLPDDGRCAILNFSDECKYSGWAPKDHALKEGKPVLETLDTYLGGGSNLDTNSLFDLRDAQYYLEGGLAVLLVTGERVDSFQGVPELFKELEEKGYCTGLVDIHGINEESKGFEAICIPKILTKIADCMENFADYAFTQK